MGTLERNRVFEMAALEEMREGVVTVLEEADRISRDFEHETESAKMLFDRVPAECRDYLFQDFSGTSDFLKPAYLAVKGKVIMNIGKLTAEIPPRDETAAKLQESAAQVCERCSRMLAGLGDMLDGGLLSEGYEAFSSKLQSYETEWKARENSMQASGEEALSALGFAAGSVMVGDPVNAGSGNFIFKETLLYINGRFPLDFTYSYNSMAHWKGSMGRCFRHSMEICLETDGKTSYVCGGDGNRIRVRKKDGKYRGDDACYYVFDGEGRCIRREDGWGNGICLSYGENGKVAEVTSDSGERLGYRYEGGMLRTISDHTGRKAVLQHRDGQLVKATDPEGNEIVYEYAANNRICRIHDRNGELQVENTYDGERRVIRQRFGDGTEASYRYMEGRETEVTGQDGRKRYHRYDEKGYRVSTRDEDGKETVDPFSALLVRETGNMAEQMDPERNARGDIVSIRRGDGRDRIVTDERGNMKELLLAEGIFFRYTYDALNRMESRTDGRGYTTTYSYDRNSRLVRTGYPDGTFRSYRYDGSGRVVFLRREDGSERRFTYDLSGHLTGMEDGKGRKATVRYDIYGRPVEAERIDGSRIQYYYGEDGSIRVQDSGRKPVKAGKPWKEPAGEEESCSYDSAGNVTERVLKDGRKYRYEYDCRNRLTAAADAEGNCWRYDYDACGRCIRTTCPTGASTEYLREESGKIYAVRDAEGTITLLEDWEGEWREEIPLIPDSGEEASGSLNGMTEEYDPVGRLVGRSYPGGVESRYEYDACGRICAIRHMDRQGMLEGFTYGYDGNGSCISIKKERRDCPQGSGTYTYSYDRLGRLVECRRNGETLCRYRYDAYGNRLELWKEGNHILYHYDGEGKLAGMERNGEIAPYRKEEGTERKLRRSSLPDGGSVTEEETDSGTRHYYYHGLPCGWEEEEGTAHYFLTDHTGSVLRVMDSEGRTEEVCGYDAFGIPEWKLSTPVGYGGYLSEGDGSWLTRSRKYDPYTGRFVTRDPWPGNPANPQTLNGYVYVMNRPLNLTDGSGTVPESSAEQFRQRLEEKNRSAAPDLSLSFYGSEPAQGRLLTDIYDSMGRTSALGYKGSVQVSPVQPDDGGWQEWLDEAVDSLMDSWFGDVLTNVGTLFYMTVPPTNTMCSIYMLASGKTRKEAKEEIREFTRGSLGGVIKAGGETVFGLLTMGGTIWELGELIGEYGFGSIGILASGMWEGICKTWEEDIVNGDARSRGEVFGRIAFEVGTSVAAASKVKEVGTAGKAGKAAKVADHAEDAAHAAKGASKGIKDVAGDVAEAGAKKLDDVAEAGAKKLDDVVEAGAKKLDDVAEAGVKKLDDAVDEVGEAAVKMGSESSIDSIIKNGKVSIDDLKANPSVFSGKSVDEIAQALTDAGYDVTVKASTRSRSGAQIIKINNPGGGKNISQVQVSPGGGRHGSSPYVKISTTDQGIIKIIDGLESLYKTDGKETATIIFSGGN